MKIIVALGESSTQVSAARLLLNRQRAKPKSINAAIFITELFDVVLKADDAALGQAEHLKKLMPEDL